MLRQDLLNYKIKINLIKSGIWALNLLLKKLNETNIVYS
jgi:hypothetical protein